MALWQRRPPLGRTGKRWPLDKKPQLPIHRVLPPELKLDSHAAVSSGLAFQRSLLLTKVQTLKHEGLPTRLPGGRSP